MYNVMFELSIHGRKGGLVEAQMDGDIDGWKGGAREVRQGRVKGWVASSVQHGPRRVRRLQWLGQNMEDVNSNGAKSSKGVSSNDARSF